MNVKKFWSQKLQKYITIDLNDYSEEERILWNDYCRAEELYNPNTLWLNITGNFNVKGEQYWKEVDKVFLEQLYLIWNHNMTERIEIPQLLQFAFFNKDETIGIRLKLSELRFRKTWITGFTPDIIFKNISENLDDEVLSPIHEKYLKNNLKNLII